MTVAFVLSGGASLGAVQVGMAQALESEGIGPEMVVGTSVGAVNGAWLAGQRPVGGLADLWRSMKRSTLFPLRPLVGLRGFAGRTNHVVPNSGLRRLLERHVTFPRLEGAPIPFSVITTEARSGEEVVLDRGPTVEAILASSALPGIFPPVTIGGRTLIDGGVVDNTPISQAIIAGADEVWVLAAGFSCALQEAPRGALEMGMHAVGLLVQQRLVMETTGRDYPVPVHLIPPPCPISVTPTDFSQGAELIERSRATTLQWLRDGRPEVRPRRIDHDGPGVDDVEVGDRLS